MTNLESELGRRAADGRHPTTLAEIRRQLKLLGYRLDMSLQAKCIVKIMTGPGAGETYPCNTIYIREIDTGMCAFHFQARRDDNFKELQRLRFEEALFAVVRGYITGF